MRSMVGCARGCVCVAGRVFFFNISLGHLLAALKIMRCRSLLFSIFIRASVFTTFLIHSYFTDTHTHTHMHMQWRLQSSQLVIMWFCWPLCLSLSAATHTFSSFFGFCGYSCKSRSGPLASPWRWQPSVCHFLGSDISLAALSYLFIFAEIGANAISKMKSQHKNCDNF